MITVMESKEDDLSFEERLQQEYEEAVQNGFQGTKDEYFQLRDFT